MDKISLKKLYQWAVCVLKQKQIEAPERTARDLLLHGLKISQVHWLTHPDQTVAKRPAAHYQWLIKQRSQHVPLQYLLGTEYFLGESFRVGPGVLVPRPETELVIEEAKRVLTDKRFSGMIADLGTGSGILALALGMTYPQAEVWGVDCSAAALKWARLNRKKFHQKKVRFVLGDADQPISKKKLGCFSLVVSNPPYIPRTELRTLQAEVKKEPRLALDGGPDGLRLIRHMVQAAKRLLQARGYFICEIGIRQSTQVIKFLEQAGFDSIEVIRDWQKIPRVVSARLSAQA